MKNFTRFYKHLNNKDTISKKQVLTLIALVMVAISYAQTFTALDNNNNTLEFNITSATTVEVKDYISGGTNVDIPATVTYNSTTYNVTGIGILAFLNNGLTSAIMPASVSSIGVGAFQNNALGSITIPDGITSIPNNTFYDNQLTSITIPNSVTTIGNNAFKDNLLTSVTFGNSVSSIGEFTFHNNQLTSITLPNSITAIGNIAFQGNPLNCVVSEAVTPPTINTSNNGLDTFSFAQRSNINLTIPTGTASDYLAAAWIDFNSVTEGVTGNFTVNHITYAVTSTTNNTVKTINYNTTGGTVVNIPTTVTRGCETYTVTEIGNNSFQSKGLTAVTIPNTIVNIGINAFFTNNLTSVTIPDSVLTIDEIAFAQNQNMTTLVLGNNVTSIGDAAFRFCALSTITLPASVTNIGVVAFGGLGGPEAITDIYCQGLVPPTIVTTGAPNSDTFNQARSTIHLHIPAGTMGVYVTDAGALWTGFNPVTEYALSVDDFQLQNAVKVITNPGSINIINTNGLQLYTYELYSITGAKIKTGTTTQIATHTIAKGIYVIKLEFNQGTLIKKVIIK